MEKLTCGFTYLNSRMMSSINQTIKQPIQVFAELMLILRTGATASPRARAKERAQAMMTMAPGLQKSNNNWSTLLWLTFVYLLVYKFTLNYFFMFIEPIPLVLHHHRGWKTGAFLVPSCAETSPLKATQNYCNTIYFPWNSLINSNSQRIIYLEIYRLSKFLSAVFIGMSQELYLFCYIVT